MYDRDATFIHARILTHTRARARSRYAVAAVCIGEPCEYMHKNVCFRVPAPSPRHPPADSRTDEPSRANPSVQPAARRAYTGVPRRRRRRCSRRRAYAQRRNVFGSGTYQSSVNLSGTSRNDYAHDLHRRAVAQSCIRTAILAPARDSRCGYPTVKELCPVDTDACGLPSPNALSMPDRVIAHNPGISYVSITQTLANIKPYPLFMNSPRQLGRETTLRTLIS